jgi:hypothetical protein
MSLNKLGFWAVSLTTLLVSFMMAVEHLGSQGFFPSASKASVMTWGIIFVAMFVTVKLLSVFEQMNVKLDGMKEELTSAQWQLSTLTLERTSGEDYTAASTPVPLRQLVVGSNVLPFPVTRPRRKSM